MFDDASCNKEIYAGLMDSLKKENYVYKELQKSDAVKYGRYLIRIKENILHPTVLMKKINTTRGANAVIKSYPQNNNVPNKKKNSNYFCNDRIAIYTAVFGRYDTVKEPIWKPNNCDYYIVTDQDVPSDSEWKKVGVDWKYLDIKDNILQNRYCKMFPHKLPTIGEYKYSIYIDGNIQPITDFTEFVNEMGKLGIALHLHSSRDCVYQEAEACIMSGKETKNNIKKHIDFLKSEGFPEHYGMLECNLIVRDHNSQLMKSIMELWWREFCERAKRDQLSLPYVLFKLGIKVEEIGRLGNNIFMNDALRVLKHE